MHTLHVAGEITLILFGICVPCALFITALVLKVERNETQWAVITGTLGVLITIAMMTVLALHTERTRLCLKGHEMYQLFGKTMQRVWVCEDEQR